MEKKSKLQTVRLFSAGFFITVLEYFLALWIVVFAMKWLNDHTSWYSTKFNFDPTCAGLAFGIDNSLDSAIFLLSIGFFTALPIAAVVAGMIASIKGIRFISIVISLIAFISVICVVLFYNQTWLI